MSQTEGERVPSKPQAIFRLAFRKVGGNPKFLVVSGWFPLKTMNKREARPPKKTGVPVVSSANFTGRPGEFYAIRRFQLGFHPSTGTRGSHLKPPPKPPSTPRQAKKRLVDLPSDIYGVAIAVAVGDLACILSCSHITKADSRSGSIRESGAKLDETGKESETNMRGGSRKGAKCLTP